MQIFLSTPSGTLCQEFASHSCVAEVKRRFLVARDQWLTWAAKKLDDEQTLKSYSISDGSTVTLVGRLLGGGDSKVNAKCQSVELITLECKLNFAIF